MFTESTQWIETTRATLYGSNTAIREYVTTGGSGSAPPMSLDLMAAADDIAAVVGTLARTAIAEGVVPSVSLKCFWWRNRRECLGIAGDQIEAYRTVATLLDYYLHELLTGTLAGDTAHAIAELKRLGKPFEEVSSIDKWVTEQEVLKAFGITSSTFHVKYRPYLSDQDVLEPLEEVEYSYGFENGDFQLAKDNNRIDPYKHRSGAALERGSAPGGSDDIVGNTEDRYTARGFDAGLMPVSRVRKRVAEREYRWEAIANIRRAKYRPNKKKRAPNPDQPREGGKFVKRA